MPKQNFQDTFTKNENSEDLQYDDIAFAFFSLSLLTIILIPYFFFLMKKFRKLKKVNHQKYHTCKCYDCQNKIQTMSKNRKINFSLIFETCLFIILVYFWSLSAKQCLNNNNLKSFDPYEILSLDMSATDTQIKKKFKQLARQFHPDKNPGDPDAHKQFILINKAYECLENEESRNNCLEKGNPEGNSGSQEVGIAFPPFLLKKENRSLILSLFFILILFILPMIVMYFYKYSDRVDDFGTEFNFYNICLEYIKNEHIQFQNFLELFSLSEKMKDVYSSSPQQQPFLAKLIDPDLKPKNKKKFHYFKKPFYILNAYMKGKKIDDVLQKDLYYILENCINLIHSVIEVTIQVYKTDPEQQKQMFQKVMKFDMVERGIKFSQHFYQGLALEESELLQIPGINRINIDKFLKKNKNKSITYFLFNEEGREKIAEFYKHEQKYIQEFDEARKCFPQIEFQLKAFVEEEENFQNEEIHKGDLYTLNIKINRKNEKNGFIHSKRFPFLKKEQLFLFVFENKSQSLVYFKRLVTQESIIEEKFQHYFFIEDSVEFKVIVKSDSYIGFDQEQNIKINFLPERIKQEFKIHPEDEKALNEETLFKKMMKEMQQEENSDDELEEEDEEQVDEQDQDDDEQEDEIQEKKVQNNDDDIDEDYETEQDQDDEDEDNQTEDESDEDTTN